MFCSKIEKFGGELQALEDELRELQSMAIIGSVDDMSVLRRATDKLVDKWRSISDSTKVRLVACWDFFGHLLGVARTNQQVSFHLLTGQAREEQEEKKAHRCLLEFLSW